MLPRILALFLIPWVASADQSPDLAKIGRFIFTDTTLSNPPGQSCLTCHQPDHAFADPRRVSPGANPTFAGTRNAPSLMYAALIPPFAYEDILLPDGSEIFAWEGGLFQDCLLYTSPSPRDRG